MKAKPPARRSPPRLPPSPTCPSAPSTLQPTAMASPRAGRSTKITAPPTSPTRSPRALQNLTYGYDADNNVNTITDAVNAANGQTLGYDVLNRINSAVSGTGGYGSLIWTYDNNGNVKSFKVGSAPPPTPIPAARTGLPPSRRLAFPRLSAPMPTAISRAFHPPTAAPLRPSPTAKPTGWLPSPARRSRPPLSMTPSASASARPTPAPHPLHLRPGQR